MVLSSPLVLTNNNGGSQSRLSKAQLRWLHSELQIPFPNIERWLDDMANMEGHDDVHVVLEELGDISVEAPSMEMIRNANKRAVQVLQQKVEQFGKA